jgi:hypothetical protein
LLAGRDQRQIGGGECSTSQSAATEARRDFDKCRAGGREVRRLATKLARFSGYIVLALAVLLFGTWCSVAVWFRLGTTSLVRDVLAAATFVLTLATVASFATSWRWRAFAVFFGLGLVVLIWWSAIAPSNDRAWAPDVARTVTATIDGDTLIIRNLRNFDWRSDSDFDERWEERTYELSQLANVDLIASYWSGEAIAHTIISFGFQDGSRLAFSIEIRKERGEAYSSLAGFFKQYELAFIAADERDLIRVRSNIRGEDVRIYRLRMSPANAQALLRKYVAEANDLARQPRFYNTLTANCTTLVFAMVRAIHPGLPMDPRVVLSGYLPNYAYELGATDTSMPFEKLRQLSKIHDKAVAADVAPDFSVRIREGLPIPH